MINRPAIDKPGTIYIALDGGEIKDIEEVSGPIDSRKATKNKITGNRDS